MSEHKSRFLIKQRAFLKNYLIYLAEKERLYGLMYLKNLKDEFELLGYKPNHSEIYKSLHELEEEGILVKDKRVKEGKKLQEVVFYRVKDQEKAKLYKKQVKIELERCNKLLSKALSDVYS